MSVPQSQAPLVYVGSVTFINVNNICIIKDLCCYCLLQCAVLVELLPWLIPG